MDNQREAFEAQGTYRAEEYEPFKKGYDAAWQHREAEVVALGQEILENCESYDIQFNDDQIIKNKLQAALTQSRERVKLLQGLLGVVEDCPLCFNGEKNVGAFYDNRGNPYQCEWCGQKDEALTTTDKE